MTRHYPQYKSGDSKQSIGIRKRNIVVLFSAAKADRCCRRRIVAFVSRAQQHIQRIREKTQFPNRTELAVRARERGRVIVDDKV